jgi:hypothetical protein
MDIVKDNEITSIIKMIKAHVYTRKSIAVNDIKSSHTLTALCVLLMHKSNNDNVKPVHIRKRKRRRMF